MNPYSYQGFSSGGTGKLYVPVNRNSLVYSHFDHVSGVAAGAGQRGISISKIRILNSLIDRISAIKNQPVESVTEMSDGQADALISQYQQQIQQAVAQTPYMLAGAQPQPGVLFSFQA